MKFVCLWVSVMHISYMLYPELPGRIQRVLVPAGEGAVTSHRHGSSPGGPKQSRRGAVDRVSP